MYDKQADTDNATEYMNEVTKVGKIITINIEIVDSEKAKLLLSTMYGKNIDQLGVSVVSWGFCDIQTANDIRIEMLKKELFEHQQRINNILNQNNIDLLADNNRL